MQLDRGGHDKVSVRNLKSTAILFDEQLYNEAPSFKEYECPITLEFRVRYLAFQHFKELNFHPDRLDLMIERHESLREFVGKKAFKEMVDIILNICIARRRAYNYMIDSVYYNNGKLDLTTDVPKEMKGILFDTNLLTTFMRIGCGSKPEPRLKDFNYLSDLIIDARLRLDSFELWERRMNQA